MSLVASSPPKSADAMQRLPAGAKTEAVSLVGGLPSATSHFMRPEVEAIVP